MITIAEKKVNTGNFVLDMELPLLNEDSLTKLADYAQYLRWRQQEQYEADD